jgi:hypothetical protein
MITGVPGTRGPEGSITTDDIVHAVEAGIQQIHTRQMMLTITAGSEQGDTVVEREFTCDPS